MIEMYRPLEPLERDVLTLLLKGWTSPLDALRQAQCLSLSQRVGSLSRQGYQVEKEWHKLPSGKTVRRYRIKAETPTQIIREITASHYDLLNSDSWMPSTDSA
jgi:hypothetical protein